MLYFAYTSLIAPDRITDLAPSAAFKFVAHLPETRLVFPISNGKWDGGLPSVVPAPGNTVWGAIFEIPEHEVDRLDAAEKREGRVRATVSAMDRSGKRHKVATHVHSGNGKTDHEPSSSYMEIVVEGGRHWQLPAGWIAGLEEYVRVS